MLLRWKEFDFKRVNTVFSYLFQKAKCSGCSKKILFRYPVVEIITITLGIICYMQYGISLEFFVWFTIYYLLLVIGFIDYISFIIPNVLVLLLFISSLVKVLIFEENLIVKLSISIGLLIILTAINILSSKIKKEIMGYGDIKLISVLFLLLSLISSLINIWLSSVLGVAGFYLLKITVDRFRTENRIPFGFFLAFGFIVTHLLETQIIHSYLKLAGI